MEGGGNTGDHEGLRELTTDVDRPIAVDRESSTLDYEGRWGTDLRNGIPKSEVLRKSRIEGEQTTSAQRIDCDVAGTGDLLLSHEGRSEKSPSSKRPRSDPNRGPLTDGSSKSNSDTYEINLPSRAGTANISKLLRLCSKEKREEVESIIMHDKKYRSAASLCPVAQRAAFKNKLVDKEVADLLSAGVIRPIKKGENIIFQCKVFTIVEEAKGKKRLIIEPRDLNRLFRVSKCKLPNVQSMKGLVRGGEYLMQWDFACWFYQIPLDESIQKYFGVVINGQEYVLTCLPMGFTASVFVAQSLSEAATNVLNPREVYIDNIFRANGPNERPETTHRKLSEHLEKLGVVLKEAATEGGPQLDILGIHCDAIQKTISLAPKFFKHHGDIIASIAQSKEVYCSVRDMMRFIGVLCRGIYVLQLGFGNYIDVLITSSIISKMKLSDQVCWTIDEVSKSLARLILSNPPHSCLEAPEAPRDDDAYLVTDASLTGYGYIWVSGGQVVMGGGPWTMQVPDNMPMLEAMCILIAIQSLERHGYSVKKSRLYTDSQTFCMAFAKGYSKKSPEINEAVRLVAGRGMVPFHIRSSDNPADPLSRNRQLTADDWRKLDYLGASPQHVSMVSHFSDPPA